MYNEIIKYKWNKFLQESERGELLDRYIASYVLTVNKQIILRNEVSNKLRMIPNVTVVNIDLIGQEGESTYRALYHIKFALDAYENLDVYINKILHRQIKKIEGITINAYKGVEKIEI